MSAINYLWNPLNDNIVREFDDAGTVIAEYTTEPSLYGNVVSQRRNGQDSVYHYDGQGSTLALTDANGNMTDTYAYSAFGEVTAHSGSTVNPFQYVGQKQYYRDSETGEDNVRRRSLRSERWLSRDPLCVYDTTNSLYLYTGNSPVLEIDPSGLLSQRPFFVWPKIGKDPLLCGAFVFATRWVLDEKEKKDGGLIFQRVCSEKEVTMCRSKDRCDEDLNDLFTAFGFNTGKCKNTQGCDTKCYVEVWQVIDGQIFGGLFKAKPTINPGAEDYFAYTGCSKPKDNPSYGTIKKTGHSFFISKDRLDQWDAGWLFFMQQHFKAGKEGVNSACSLPSACDSKLVPGFGTVKELFEFFSKKGTGETVKEVTVEWNCCKKCETGKSSRRIGDRYFDIFGNPDFQGVPDLRPPIV